MRCSLFWLVILLTACSNPGQPPLDASSDLQLAEESSVKEVGLAPDAADQRPLHLGFTSFPYDITAAAVDDVYAKLATDADLYAFHTTEGVPWVEAGAGLPLEQWGQALRDKWVQQRGRVVAGHSVYLGLTPLDDARAGMADYWGSSEHMALPAPWDSYSFDAPQVKAAYLTFCREAVRFYSPDYLAIGLEVNLLLKNAPEKWDAYLELHEATYTALKAEFPNLPIFGSLTAVDLLEGWTDADHAAQQASLSALMPFSDYLALSLYPFMSVYLTDDLPAGYFDQLAALAGDKPMVIAESGYMAQRTELSTGLVFAGTEEKQASFVGDLLDAARSHAMPFVVNFVLQDYDPLWEKAGRGDPLAIWRDTGLYGETGEPRQALVLWREALATP